MTSSRLTIALMWSIICTSISTADTFTPAAFARDPGVDRWIWYQILGPSNHPNSIVYVSTQHFQTRIGEFLIVLRPARFNVLATYTRGRIARADCPGKTPRGDVWHTVEIAEHHDERTQRCILPQALACEYLSGVLELSGIAWTAKETEPITDFMSDVKCDTGTTNGGKR